MYHYRFYRKHILFNVSFIMFNFMQITTAYCISKKLFALEIRLEMYEIVDFSHEIQRKMTPLLHWENAYSEILIFI